MRVKKTTTNKQKKKGKETNKQILSIRKHPNGYLLVATIDPDYNTTDLQCTGVLDSQPKWTKFESNVTNLATFKIRFQCILAKCTEI